jgi:hypothetical protein
LTQTLKALDVRPPISARGIVHHDDDGDDDTGQVAQDKTGGFFSRFKR